MARTASFVLVILAVAIAANAQGTIKGCIKDTAGAALPGVEVLAASGDIREVVHADAIGCYEIKTLRVGIYTVTATLNGFVPGKRESVRVESGRDSSPVDFALAIGPLAEICPVTAAVRNGAVSGCVVDFVFHKPLGPAWISVTNSTIDRRATADSNGCFSFIEVPPGRYTVRVAVPAFCDGVVDDLTVVSGELAVANFTLRLGPISDVIGYTWKGWGELMGRTDAVVHLRIEEVLDTKAWPSTGCGSPILTEYRVSGLSIVKGATSTDLAPGPLRVFWNRTWSGSPDSPAMYHVGDEFVAFLRWLPSFGRLELDLPEGGVMVPLKDGMIAWKGSDAGKTVHSFLVELRALVKR
ncbi:MAG: carboxypeptidase-like regulatory domain-containing protein [Acidobacteria bacterium]|nr:carboxypeptidase-like regulatory domain-containing protein [Acidobacteriota bacterium]